MFCLNLHRGLRAMLNRKPINQKGYIDSVVNLAESEATYYLYAPIDDYAYEGVVTAKEFADWLNGLAPSIKTINIRINSPGGSVFAARAMEQHVREITDKTVNTYIDGVVASAATYIALAGHNVFIAEGAFIMIHKASSLAIGNSFELMKVAGMLEKLDISIIDTYQKRTGLDRSEIEKMIEAETWLNAEEAIALKFADIINTNKVEAPKNQAVLWNLSEFKNAPETLKSLAEAPENISQKTVGDEAKKKPENKTNVAYLLRKIEVAERTL